MEELNDVRRKAVEVGLVAIQRACMDIEEAFQQHEACVQNLTDQRSSLYTQRLAEIEELRVRTTAELDAMRAALTAERAAFEAEKAKMDNVYTFQKEKIKLDIGGTRYSASRTTLLSQPNTFFHGMLSGRYTLEKDEDGSFFIDRDGRHFHYILNFLRKPDAFEAPSDPLVLKELLAEAEYYEVGALKDVIVAQADAKKPQAPTAFPATPKQALTPAANSNNGFLGAQDQSTAANLFGDVASASNNSRSSATAASALFHAQSSNSHQAYSQMQHDTAAAAPPPLATGFSGTSPFAGAGAVAAPPASTQSLAPPSIPNGHTSAPPLFTSDTNTNSTASDPFAAASTTPSQFARQSKRRPQYATNPEVANPVSAAAMFTPATSSSLVPPPVTYTAPGSPQHYSSYASDASGMMNGQQNGGGQQHQYNASQGTTKSVPLFSPKRIAETGISTLAQFAGSMMSTVSSLLQQDDAYSAGQQHSQQNGAQQSASYSQSWGAHQQQQHVVGSSAVNLFGQAEEVSASSLFAPPPVSSSSYSVHQPPPLFSGPPPTAGSYYSPAQAVPTASDASGSAAHFFGSSQSQQPPVATFHEPQHQYHAQQDTQQQEVNVQNGQYHHQYDHHQQQQHLPQSAPLEHQQQETAHYEQKQQEEQQQHQQPQVPYAKEASFNFHQGGLPRPDFPGSLSATTSTETVFSQVFSENLSAGDDFASTLFGAQKRINPIPEESEIVYRSHQLNQSLDPAEPPAGSASLLFGAPASLPTAPFTQQVQQQPESAPQEPPQPQEQPFAQMYNAGEDQSQAHDQQEQQGLENASQLFGTLPHGQPEQHQQPAEQVQQHQYGFESAAESTSDTAAGLFGDSSAFDGQQQQQQQQQQQHQSPVSDQPPTMPVFATAEHAAAASFSSEQTGFLGTAEESAAGLFGTSPSDAGTQSISGTPSELGAVPSPQPENGDMHQQQQQQQQQDGISPQLSYESQSGSVFPGELVAEAPLNEDFDEIPLDEASSESPDNEPAPPPSGAALLASMTLDPITHKMRDSLRGWNDPPINFTKSIGRSRSSQSSMTGLEDAVVPGATSSSQDRDAEVRSLLQGISTRFASAIESCKKEANAGLVKKITESTSKLTLLYGKIESGEVSLDFAKNLFEVSNALFVGDADRAATLHHSLASSSSLDEVGTGLTAVKSLINSVKAKQKKSWKP